MIKKLIIVVLITVIVFGQQPRQSDIVQEKVNNIRQFSPLSQKYFKEIQQDNSGEPPGYTDTKTKAIQTWQKTTGKKINKVQYVQLKHNDKGIVFRLKFSIVDSDDTVTIELATIRNFIQQTTIVQIVQITPPVPSLLDQNGKIIQN